MIKMDDQAGLIILLRPKATILTQNYIKHEDAGVETNYDISGVGNLTEIVRAPSSTPGEVMKRRKDRFSYDKFKWYLMMRVHRSVNTLTTFNSACFAIQIGFCRCFRRIYPAC